MKRTDKEQFVTNFRERLGGASTMYLTDFSGLDVKSLTTLRSALRADGAEFLVVKNRIAKLALAELDLPDLVDHLVGPTGFVIAGDDAVLPAQTIKNFAKAHDDRPVFKVGILDAKLVEADQIKKIADLPPREQLLAELAGAFEAPMAAFAAALGALTQELAGLFDALIEEKS